MEMKKNLCRGLGSWSLPVLLSVFLFASCKDDLQTSVHTGLGIRFSVSDGALWHVTRAAGSPAEATTPRDSLLGVLPLQAGDGGDGLYLHALLSGNTGNALADDEPIGTRSAPVKEMETYGKFGVFAYLYTDAWDGSATPDFMYNMEVRGDGGVWSPAVAHNWPGKGKKLRFFAYAPYNAPGIVLPAQHVAGFPDFTYTVPEKIQDQKDLLVAASGEMAGDHNGMAPLTFRHALTAVRFVVGEDMQKGKVTNITLKNVYGKAVYDMDGGAWSAFEEKRDFSQELEDKKVNGQAGEEITPEADTFMMIPQDLPGDAGIEVVFTDDLTGTARTLTASVAEATWPRGKTVTYRISTSSIAVVPTFTVTAPEDFEYTGGDGTYTVTSYASVSRQGDPTKTVPVAWTAEFSTDGGQTWVKEKTDWLTTFTTNGNGSLSAMDFTAGVAAQQAVVSNPHDEELQKATSVSGIHDLSTNGGITAINTANCYIVNKPGKYSLPLVYGNAVKDGKTNSAAYTSTATGAYALEKFVNHRNAVITDPYIYKNAGCTPDNACIVWQDEQDLVTGVDLAEDNKILIFEVPKGSIRQGNAILAVRDASNTILWSWHIWVTDYVPGLPATIETSYDPTQTPRDKVVTNNDNARYTFMGTNLGWCEPATMTYAARGLKVRFTQVETGKSQVITVKQVARIVKSFGDAPLYQFGRKDPMLSGILREDGTFSDKNYYSGGDYRFDHSGKGKVSLGVAIKNPHIFYNYGSGVSYYWFDANATVRGKNGFYNLWSMNNASGGPTKISNVVKTIYDPSPVGYCVPPENAFWGFTWIKDRINGEWKHINTPSASQSKLIEDQGWTFYCNRMKGVGDYDPSDGVIFFPAAGKRIHSSGVLDQIGTIGFYWAVEAKSQTSVGGLDFDLTLTRINPAVRNAYSHGFSVRPVRE